MARISALIISYVKTLVGTIFNASDKSANILLAPGALAVSQSSTGDQGVRSVVGETTGKYYTECTWTNLPQGTDSGYGFCTSSASLTSLGASSANASICFKSGAIWSNGSSTGISLSTFATSDVICCALDLVNSRIWFRKNGGNWNNSGTADPATNTGGVSISGFQTNNVTLIMACVCVNVSQDKLTGNFGDSAFSFTVPSGFKAGFPGV